MNSTVYSLILTLTLLVTPATHAMRLTRTVITTPSLRPTLQRGTHALAPLLSTHKNEREQFKDTFYSTHRNNSLPFILGAGFAAATALQYALAQENETQEEQTKTHTPVSIEKLDEF